VIDSLESAKPTAAETTGEKYLLSCIIQLNEEPEPAATFQ